MGDHETPDLGDIAEEVSEIAERVGEGDINQSDIDRLGDLAEELRDIPDTPPADKPN